MYIFVLNNTLNMDKVLFLIRGLPGAGKSTLAKNLGALFFEADMYFLEGNEYKFNPLKLRTHTLGVKIKLGYL